MNSKTKLISSILLFLIVAALGYYMIQLSAKEQLWGHLPMFIFLAAWGLNLTLFSKAFFHDQEKKKYFLYSCGSAALFYFGFPTMPFFFLLFVAFVPLLLMEHELSQKEAKPFWKIWRCAYNAFVLWNILSTFWVGNTAFAAGIFAILVNSLLMTIPFMLFHLSKKVLSDKLAAVAFIAYWISFEKLHQGWELSWTWLTLGNAFSQHTWLIQWYEFTGVFGGSLWILVLNFMLFYAYRKRSNIKDLWPSVLVVAIPILSSLIINVNTDNEGPEKKVCIVQPNYEPHYQKFTVPPSRQLRKFLKLANEGIDEGTDYCLFPETSFRATINDHNNESSIKSINKLVEQFPNLKVVTGLAAYKIFEEGEEKSEDTIRKSKRSGRSVFYETYNAAVQIDKDQELDLYKKSILVPGAEIFPYKEIFFFFKPLVDQLGGTLAGNGTQKERSVFWDEDEAFAVAPVICYESIYGDYCTEYIRKGANAIFIMTNDGWWDDTAGHKQHLLFARLRAIETRRSIARSANTGISCFIDQKGSIYQATAYEVDAAVKGSIQMNDRITFYVIWGDLIARISLLLAILLILNTIVKSLQKKTKNQDGIT